MCQIAKANFWLPREKCISASHSAIINCHEKYFGFQCFKQMTLVPGCHEVISVTGRQQAHWPQKTGGEEGKE